MKIRTAGLTIIAWAMAGATTAAAQTTDTGLDRAEARRDRSSQAESGSARAFRAGAEPEPHWTLSFALPFTFNTNVGTVESGAQNAFHADPSISLEGSWTRGRTEFFVEMSADDDSYTSHTENDSATLYGRAGIRHGDPTKGISPYIHYTFIGLYGPHFDSHAVSTHYFTLGGTRRFNLSRDRSITIDVSLLRREASIREVEQNRATLALSFGQKLDAATRWSLSGRIQYADYTGGTADGRHDLTMRAAAAIRHTVNPNLELSGQIYFQSNQSNRIGKDYSVWDFGPAITLSTTF